MSEKIAEKTARYPEFIKIVNLISEQNPLQHKRIQGFVMTQDEHYWAFAEDLSRVINRALVSDEGSRLEVAQAYNDLCMGMLRDQIKFRKTGVYPTDDAEKPCRDVYNQPETMYRYVVGLLISHMLWPNHYKLFRFFQEVLAQSRPVTYLEVGAGHGLFVLEALRCLPQLEVVVCDISKTSIEISQRILSSFGIDISKVEFIHKDFRDLSFDGRSFDFITLGEVLEHVEEPVGFMRLARKFLLPDGIVYISTCANCPAVDHLYHFHNVEEIRQVFSESGFSIDDEITLPAEDVPRELWQKELVTINYAAKLLHNNTEKG